MSTVYLAGSRKVPVSLTTNGKRISLRFRYDRKLVGEVKAMRGASWDGDHWTVKDCPRNWVQIDLLRGVMPEVLEPYYQSKAVDWEPPGHLWQHQQDMVRHILYKRRVIIAAEMGTGKTLAAIEANRYAGGRWAWVTLAGLIESTELEFEKWGLQPPTMFSYESFDGSGDWDGVVFDESTNGGLKSPGVHYRQACKAAEGARYVVLMSGTPAPHSPMDWWTQCEIVCPGFIKEGSRNAFEARLAILEDMAVGDKVFKHRVGWREDEVEALGRRLEPLVFKAYARDCHDLPKPVAQVVECQPSDETLRLAWLAVENSATTIEALSKLRQISDGFLYSAGTRRETPKVGALRRIIRNHSRVSVYASYRESIDICSEACAAEGFEVVTRDGRGWRRLQGGRWSRVRDVKSVLRRLDKTLDTGSGRLAYVANPLSGGIGLNLTACPVAVFYSNDFNWGARAQALKRSHRPGMGESFTYYDLVHLPTDRKVLENYSRKKKLQAVSLGDTVTLEALKEAMSNG